MDRFYIQSAAVLVWKGVTRAKAERAQQVVVKEQNQGKVPSAVPDGQ